MMAGNDPAARDNRGSIVEVLPTIHEPHHSSNAFDRAHHFSQHLQIIVDELRSQYEVFWRISRQCQLGKHHQVSFHVPSRLDATPHQSSVPLKVADDRIHLCQRNAQNSHHSAYKKKPSFSPAWTGPKDGIVRKQKRRLSLIEPKPSSFIRERRRRRHSTSSCYEPGLYHAVF